MSDNTYMRYCHWYMKQVCELTPMDPRNAASRLIDRRAVHRAGRQV